MSDDVNAGSTGGDVGRRGYTLRRPHRIELAATRDLMIEVIAQDYGYDYRQHWHGDTDDLAGFFLEYPRQSLLVAVAALAHSSPRIDREDQIQAERLC